MAWVEPGMKLHNGIFRLVSNLNLDLLGMADEHRYKSGSMVIASLHLVPKLWSSKGHSQSIDQPQLIRQGFLPFEYRGVG